MNLHEYQAKELLASYGLPVQGGILAHNGEEAAAAYDKLGGKFAVVKAQVHAGGRGKAGGVKVVKSREEAKEVAESLIGTNLVTYQTDANGQPVNSVWFAKTCILFKPSCTWAQWLTVLPAALHSWLLPKAAWKSKKLLPKLQKKSSK